MNKIKRWHVLALVLPTMAVTASAQTAAPGNDVRPQVEPLAVPPMTAATAAAREPLSTAITVRPRPAPVTLVGSGTAVSEGVRVLRTPGACTPKTNSLDCVQDSSQAGEGANVSGRVRGGVIGEVGTGRAATEGKGGAQRKEACTPKPGELSCSP